MPHLVKIWKYYRALCAKTYLRFIVAYGIKPRIEALASNEIVAEEV